MKKKVYCVPCGYYKNEDCTVDKEIKTINKITLTHFSLTTNTSDPYITPIEEV